MSYREELMACGSPGIIRGPQQSREGRCGDSFSKLCFSSLYLPAGCSSSEMGELPQAEDGAGGPLSGRGPSVLCGRAQSEEMLRTPGCWSTGLVGFSSCLYLPTLHPVTSNHTVLPDSPQSSFT